MQYGSLLQCGSLLRMHSAAIRRYGSPNLILPRAAKKKKKPAKKQKKESKKVKCLLYTNCYHVQNGDDGSFKMG